MLELVVCTFDGSGTAAAALGVLRRDPDVAWTWLDDVAVVERHHSGRVASHLSHASVTDGVTAGVLTGALVGLLFPPAAMGALAVLAGTAGAGIEELRKREVLPAPLVDDIRADLAKGTSALLLVAAPVETTAFVRALEPLGVTGVRREELPDVGPDDLGLGLA